MDEYGITRTTAVQQSSRPSSAVSRALDVPPPDPFQTSVALISVAIEQGSVRDFPPIPLDQDGATTHGVVFDHFRMIARAARAAASRRRPGSIPRRCRRRSRVHARWCSPIPCRAMPEPSRPAAVEILGAQGTAIRRDGDYMRDAAIGTLLPGVQAPVSSLAATFTAQPHCARPIRSGSRTPIRRAPAERRSLRFR